MYPWVIGSFGSYNIRHPHPGDPAGVDQTPTCVQLALAPPHRPLLLIRSHLESFSAASVMFLMAFVLPIPVIPSALKVL